MLLALSCWLVVANAAPLPPSVAIMPLEPEGGAHPSLVKITTEQLLAEAQRSAAFSRLVSYKETETILGLEKQRQLLTCTEESCVAELAGALGVDLLLNGMLARVGQTYVLSLRLLNARAGTLVAAVSERTSASSDEGVLDLVHPAFQKLITQAGLSTATGTEPSLPPSSNRRLGTSALLAGGGAMGAAVLLGLVSLGVAAAGVLGVVVPLMVYVPTPGLSGQQRVVLLPGAGTGALVLGLGSLVVSVLVLVGGGVAAGVGAVLR